MSPEEKTRAQLKAFTSGAVDEFTLGLADPALALTGALQDAARDGSLTNLRSSYGARLANKRTEDAFDEHHYGLERGAGRVVGFGGSLFVGGAGARAVSAAARATPSGARVLALLAKAPRLKPHVDPRGLMMLATAGGATSGVMGQAASDVVNQRRGNLADYGGAMVGGALGSIATLRGEPARGGAVGGVITSVTQDLLNGRRPSIEGAVEGARGGYLTAGGGGRLTSYGAAAAPAHVKGKIGEAMTGARLVASGEGIPQVKQRVPIGNGRDAIPDFTINGRHVEAKLGPSADFTKNQRILRRQQPDNFSADVWTFKDVGKVGGAAAAGLGAKLGARSEQSYRPLNRTRK
jgi:hypothetical protein